MMCRSFAAAGKSDPRGAGSYESSTRIRTNSGPSGGGAPRDWFAYFGRRQGDGAGSAVRLDCPSSKRAVGDRRREERVGPGCADPP
jgi:hypothetical protein